MEKYKVYATLVYSRSDEKDASKGKNKAAKKKKRRKWSQVSTAKNKVYQRLHQKLETKNGRRALEASKD